MKIHQGGEFVFACNSCGAIAGKDKSESDARDMARKVAEMQGWTWRHPRWQLYCPLCKGAIPCNTR